MDETIFSRLQDLAACLCATVDDGENLCFCGVLPGEQWYDMGGECDSKCGQAWVRLVNAYPSTTIGTPELTQRNCKTPLGLDLEIGVLRCLDIPDDGTAPDSATLLAASAQQVKDMLDMRKAVECCESFEEHIMVLWTPVGPAGPTVGGRWQLTVGTL